MQIFISHFDLKRQPVDIFFKTRKIKAGQSNKYVPGSLITYNMFLTVIGTEGFSGVPETVR